MKSIVSKTGTFLIIALIAAQSLSSQNRTLGLMSKDAQADHGYTLIAPLGSKETYLIDNCGKKLHQWSSTNKPGFATYMLSNGDLLRTLRLDQSSIHTGAGGGVERRNWDGVLQWRVDFSDSNILMHHDVKFMPNGNILVIAAVRVPIANAFAAGRDTSTLFADMLVDKLMEIRPIGSDSMEIVWEWFAWDHMVQDKYPTKINYGVVSDNPGKMDINFIETNVTQYKDWSHINSIDYDPILDRILVSSRTFSEIWVIDHSTTTAQAKTEAGGNSGKGGALLYRWGNPVAYKRGVQADKMLFSQHNAHWVEDHGVSNKSIMIFNNGANRPDTLYSTVDIIETPMDDAGNFHLTDGMSYGPAKTSWQYMADPPGQFFSGVYSSSQKLPNGNFVICQGVGGKIFEIDPSGQKHWEYVNPITAAGPQTQGSATRDNMMYGAPRYPQDYPAFIGKNLVAGEPLELSPLVYECTVDGPMTDVDEDDTHNEKLIATPNPFTDFLSLNFSAGVGSYTLFDVTGNEVINVAQPTSVINTTELKTGVYFLVADTGAVQKLVKLH